MSMTTQPTAGEGSHGALLEPPVLDVDPYSVENIQNPYLFFEELRETAAVVRLKPYGVYVTGRYEETKVVLNDHDRFMASVAAKAPGRMVSRAASRMPNNAA